MRRREAYFLVVSSVKLDGQLVKEVSRSFYLTLRLLPSSVREVISLGYLLARASDTIADTASLPLSFRREVLEHYQKDVKGSGQSVALAERCGPFLAQKHAGEAVLMENLGGVLEAVKRFTPQEQVVLQQVTQTIITGQLWDLTYFSSEAERVSVRDAEMLESYTYQVAGCVGEFWTDVLGLHGFIPEEEVAEMRALGIEYGKGLQLTNITRDIAEDYENGRIYIPGAGEATLHEVLEASDPWLIRAQRYLKSGETYAAALPVGRLRLASILPARLGQRTLTLLENAPYPERECKLKIPRSVVFKELFMAMWR